MIQDCSQGQQKEKMYQDVPNIKDRAEIINQRWRIWDFEWDTIVSDINISDDLCHWLIESSLLSTEKIKFKSRNDKYDNKINVKWRENRKYNLW